MSANYVTPFTDRNVSMEVLAGTSHDGVYYYVSDPLGSVRAVSGVDGAARCVYDYDAFGVKYDAGARMDFIQRYGYTGRETSVLSGAPMFFRNRIYSAGLGRFLRQDPSGFINNPDGNLYAYVGNNPVMFNDPMGLGIIGDTLGGMYDDAAMIAKYAWNSPGEFLNASWTGVTYGAVTTMDSMTLGKIDVLHQSAEFLREKCSKPDDPM